MTMLCIVTIDGEISVVVSSRPILELRSVLQPPALEKDPDEHCIPRRDSTAVGISGGDDNILERCQGYSV
jgi:hypothetical protein